MKVLYFGGQKSGKSLLAEQKTLELSGDKKPYYIATYDNSYYDLEMQERVNKHKKQREDRFISVDESFETSLIVQDGDTYLIECLSMWILNLLGMDIEYITDQIEVLSKKDANIVFVLNDVSSGIIPIDSKSRKFVDRSGIIGQMVAKMCDEVYEVKFGLPIQLK
jgi:adenosylcobinamide kinase/adenosylcobinamide-phosphate guanylyltransferase